jgi:hypothetical protein
MYANSIPTTVEQVTPATTLAWLTPLLAQDSCVCSADTLLSWHELLFNTTLVRLPTGVAPPSATKLPVQERQHTLAHPLVWRDNAAWVGGPVTPQTLNAPLELRLINEAGLLTLDITCYWAVWWAGDSPGRPLMQQTLDCLTTDGWSVT